MARRARESAECPACPDCRLDDGAAARRRAGTARPGLAAVGRSHRQLGRGQGGFRGPAGAAAAAAGEHAARPLERHRRRGPLVAGAVGHVLAAPDRRVQHPRSGASHRVLRRLPRRHRHARPLPDVRPRRASISWRLRLLRRRHPVVPLSQVSNSGVFDALAALDPHVFIHMGDLHYYNITGPAKPVEPLAGLFRAGSIACCRRSGRRCSTAARRSPTSGTTTTTAPTTPTAARRRATPRGSTTTPTCRTIRLPLAADADGPIAQAFDIGRVRFIMTDTRSERHPGERTMLGARQLAWLLAELERAARDPVALLVWVNTVPWIADDGDGNGWGPFAAERPPDRRADRRARPRPAHGDAERRRPHAGVRRRPQQPQRRLRGGPGGAARPLQRLKGGPYSHTPATQRNGQFGVLRVTDDGTR